MMKTSHYKFFGLLVFLGLGTILLLNAQTEGKGPQYDGQGLQDNVDVEDIGDPTQDDPWTEMDKLVTAYYNKQGSSFKGIIKLIDDNGPQEKLLEELSFQYMVLNGDYYYSLDKIEVVKNKNLLLVVDHENKIISMNRNASLPEGSGKLFDIAAFQKMMEETKAIAKVTQTATEKILTIEKIQDAQVQGYRIYYDPQTYRVTKMLVGMVRLNPIEERNDGMGEMPGDNENTAESLEESIETYTYYMEIIYNETSLLNTSSGNFSPENKFLVAGSAKIQLNKSYSEYQLVINNEEGENNADVEEK